MVSTWLALFLTGPAVPWDMPLVPVDNGRMVVAAECERDERLVWSSKLRRQAHGMEPGERVWLLTRTRARSIRLGEPVCYAGECGGDYASLRLPASEAIAVVPLRFLDERDLVHPLVSISGRCDRHPADGWKSGECKAFDLGSGRRLQTQTETQPTATDWDVVRTYARVTEAGAASPWQLVSEATDAIVPEALIVRGTSSLILWRQISGIGGPAEITVVLSRVESDGTLTFGRRYTAGGQPCD